MNHTDALQAAARFVDDNKVCGDVEMVVRAYLTARADDPPEMHDPPNFKANGCKNCSARFLLSDFEGVR